RRQPACAVTGDQLVPAGRRVAAYAAVAPLATGACPSDAAWHLGDHAGATADRPQPAPGRWADPVPTPGRAVAERQWLRAGAERQWPCTWMEPQRLRADHERAEADADAAARCRSACRRAAGAQARAPQQPRRPVACRQRASVGIELVADGI